MPRPTAPFVLLLLLGIAGAVSPAADATPVGGCPLFPSDNVWNTRVDHLPVAAGSAAWVETIGAAGPLHPDFGSGEWPPGSGAPIGIPFTTVPATQPKVPVSFLYAEESDPGPYPIPPDAPIEGGPAATGDRHVLVVETGSCALFEMFDAHPESAGASWSAGSGARFDLGSHDLRPETWTSADAAGLPILPGLVRYEEVEAGVIEHALRFTAPQTRRAYVWPARHYASSLAGDEYPPMGQRFRLRGDFDLGGFTPRVRVILEALQRYGMMLADNGSPWFLSGVPDERWDNDELRQLRQVQGSDFEAVDVSSLMGDPDSGRAGPPCEGPDTVVVAHVSVTGIAEHHACREVRVGPGVDVYGPAGRLRLWSAEAVVLEDGVRIFVDGELEAGH
ncbi:MAG: hypothetical protein R3325_02695 [Thermoanaerobaculia bacterium]|nr:hypothetical protein [Thermoanaerobaculia bacterium]